MFDVTGEEIELHDSGEEVLSSARYKRAEVTEAAVSGEQPFQESSQPVN